MSWPRIAQFAMEKTLKKKDDNSSSSSDPFDKLVVWAGLEPPKMKEQVEKKVKGYLAEDERVWDRKVLDYELWKYFPQGEEGEGGKKKGNNKQPRKK